MTPVSPNVLRPPHMGNTTDGAWNDLLGSIAEGAGGAALTFAALRDTPFKLASFRNNQDDELHMVYQLSHAWARGTQVRPHLHVMPLANSAGGTETADFEGYCVFTHHGSEVPALVGWTPLSASLTVTATSQYKPSIVAFGLITPPDDVIESDMLLVYVKRVGTADSFGGDVAAMSVDVHFQMEKLGSDAEIPT